MILTGYHKKMADMQILKPITTAPCDGTVIVGAYVSKTGKLMGEKEVLFFTPDEFGMDEDDTPQNFADWSAWCDVQSEVIVSPPSHWRKVS